MTKTAEELVEEASEFTGKGDTFSAIKLYENAIILDPTWSVPYYNLGLIYKYKCEWAKSFLFNEKATILNEDDEATWWNLGIAATALERWDVARKCWTKFGINVEINNEKLNLDLGMSPMRLNPDANAEVVWCDRIDPARAIIRNIPLKESNHKFGDLILNDGAPVGYRIHNGVEYAVLNELQLLNHSNYNTYSSFISINKANDLEILEKICEDVDLKMENWSKDIRILCQKCCEGIPHEKHDTSLENTTKEQHIAFAAEKSTLIYQTLNNWRLITLCEFSEVKLESV